VAASAVIRELFPRRDLTALSEKQVQDVRGNEISMISQEPMTSLNPVFTVGSQIAENVRRHQRVSGREAMTRALDVAIQAQILNLLIRLQKDLGLTYLFISHDMAVAQHMCEEIAVMYLGWIVEQAGRRSLFARPMHPYTQALLSALPKIDAEGKRRERPELRGDPPSPIDPPSGCRFHTRCPLASGICRREVPQFKEVLPGHRVACHKVSRKTEALDRLSMDRLEA